MWVCGQRSLMYTITMEPCAAFLADVNESQIRSNASKRMGYVTVGDTASRIWEGWTIRKDLLGRGWGFLGSNNRKGQKNVINYNVLMTQQYIFYLIIIYSDITESSSPSLITSVLLRFSLVHFWKCHLLINMLVLIPFGIFPLYVFSNWLKWPNSGEKKNQILTPINWHLNVGKSICRMSTRAIRSAFEAA